MFSRIIVWRFIERKRLQRGKLETLSKQGSLGEVPDERAMYVNYKDKKQASLNVKNYKQPFDVINVYLEWNI